MTSIEWLIEQFNLQAYIPHIEQAKEMHKQEIEDAFQDGKWDWSEHINNGTESKDLAQYYQETFDSKGSDTAHDTSSPTQHNSPKVENKTSFGEISDEQIEIEGWKYCYENKISSTNIVHWITACKWYREQLKQEL